MTDKKLLISEGRVIFESVRRAIDEAGFSLQPFNPQTILVWYDTLREIDYFSNLRPWQVVNRIPSINIICRKAPFIQLMTRMQKLFPDLYTFIPKSYILPMQNDVMKNLVAMKKSTYIIKPDDGSLGAGITIIKKGDKFTPVNELAVAQEYIDSYLIDDTKFDLRVYALISSVSPLQIYVYRDGIARFCSEKNSKESIFSEITNTAINRNNSNVTLESITRTIRDVFHSIKMNGVDTNLIWAKIDNAIILTILSVLNFIKTDVNAKCHPNGYNRCFQILGFDFIIDKNLNPLILEVNYRPSLQVDVDAERRLKTRMLMTAMHIATPLKNLQGIITNHKEIANFSQKDWEDFFNQLNTNEVFDSNIDTGLFDLVYPSSDQNNMKTYEHVEKVSCKCPTTLTPHYKLPLLIKVPEGAKIPKESIIIDSKKAKENVHNNSK